MKLFWKILIPLLITIIIIDGVLIYHNVTSQTSRLRNNAQNIMESHYTILSTLIKQEQEKTLALAAQIAEITGVQQAFANRDRALLMKVIGPVWRELKEKNLISTIVFLKPPARTFLLPHAMKNYNKDVSSFRRSAVIANKEKRAVTGIEAGIYELTVRGIVPVHYAGKHIGVIEAVSFLNKNLLTKFEELVQADLSVYVPKEIQKVLKKIKLGKNAPQGFRCYSSFTQKPLPIDPELYKQVMRTGKKVITQASDPEHSYNVLIAPLRDFKDDVIAIIEMREVSDAAIADIAQNRNLSLLYGIIILAVSAILIWQIVQQAIIKPLGFLSAAANEISLGNLDAAIKTTSKDEIHDLGESLERMRTSLKSAIKRLQTRKKIL